MKVKATITPTELDKAYIAGLIDGEGSIAVYKNGRSHRLQIAVKMCDLPGVEFLTARYDCTQSFYISKLNKIVHKFFIGNGPAYRFLKDIRPYLQVKAKQADVAIKFYEELGEIQHKLTDEQVKFSEECCQLLKDMKVVHPISEVA